MRDTFTILQPDDFHIHLRQDQALAEFASDCWPSFGKILVMPNTLPPISTPTHIEEYRKGILKAAPKILPLMVFKILPILTPQEVEALLEAGAVGGKLYPEGVTTHSEDGVSTIESIFPILEVLEAKNKVLCIHAEHPKAFVMDREIQYIPTLEKIRVRFPNLKMVIEHVSDKSMVDYVKAQDEKVAATITVHHLLFSLDDVIGGSLRPHHFCKPIPKRPLDRESLWRVIQDQNPKFFLGTDSAPHLREKKECAHGCAGVYSAPVAIPLLVEMFEAVGLLEILEPFTSHFGSLFYGVPKNSLKLKLLKESWEVPESLHGCIPLYAGEKLSWRIQEVIS